MDATIFITRCTRCSPASSDGYYAGFGQVSDLARVLTDRLSLHRPALAVSRPQIRRCKPKTRDGEQFVVFAQNHDQVGNRMIGERLSALVSPEKLRLAAAAVVLSPFIPMLFMGEEYGETAPFQYFTSHGDADLIEAVRKGRARGVRRFRLGRRAARPARRGDVPPLEAALATRARHESLRDLYRELLRLRREIPALRSLDLDAVRTEADDETGVLVVRRGEVTIVFNFSEVEREAAGVRVGAWDFAIRD